MPGSGFSSTLQIDIVCVSKVPSKSIGQKCSKTFCWGTFWNLVFYIAVKFLCRVLLEIGIHHHSARAHLGWRCIAGGARRFVRKLPWILALNERRGIASLTEIYFSRTRLPIDGNRRVCRRHLARDCLSWEDRDLYQHWSTCSVGAFSGRSSRRGASRLGNFVWSLVAHWIAHGLLGARRALFGDDLVDRVLW